MSAPVDYVYFFRPMHDAGGRIKIGHSRSPLDRLLVLSAWSPTPLELLATTPGGQSLEGCLHAMFWADRAHGEWFYPSAALLSLIEDVKAGRFDPDSIKRGARPGLNCWTDVSRFSLTMAAAIKRVGKAVTVPDHVRAARHAFAYGKWNKMRHRHPEDAWIVVEWLAGHGEHLNWPADLGPPPIEQSRAA